MSITLVSNAVAKRGFVVNGSTSDMSGCETLVSGVSGKNIYVERIVVSFGAAISVSIGEGESSGGVDTVLIGPLYGSANSTIEIVFGRPIKLSTATDLTADASGSGNITVIAHGYIE